MTLAVGAQLGSYVVQAAIGAGGMGEVYRARDTALARDVALKVLPSAWRDNPERVARFKREAQFLASFSHAHIAAIYGIYDGAASTAPDEALQVLVLELVEGPTLEERLQRGPLKWRDALALGKQIADALEAAHDRGIVHRDLKPANVKLRPDGVVKVLDFGIAKAFEPQSDAAAGDTAALATSATGALLGTPAYMAPEYLRTGTCDRRGDLWAFGCVLYETLTGVPAFHRGSVSETFAAVLDEPPDWSKLPPDLPGAARRLLERCLEKDPHERLRDAGDVRLLLDDALRASAGSDVAVRARRLRPAVRVGVLAAVTALGAAALGYWLGRPGAPAVAPQPMRVSVTTSQPITPQLSATLSPDGTQLAFVALDEAGRSMLWVRALDSLEARMLPGTESAVHPFWSPDGRSIGFVSGDRLRRTSAVGGAVQTLAETQRGGGSWSRDDMILFTRGFSSGLWLIPASGGTATEVTRLDPARREITHAWPQFLPDGRHFLFFVQSEQREHRGVYVGSLDGRPPVKLIDTEYKAVYTPPGYVLFVADETLMAQPFDLETLALTGNAAVVADGVWTAELAGQASFSASETGTVAYVNSSLWNTQLSWIDRQGEVLGLVGPPDRHAGQTPQLSPDGTRIAIARGRWANEQIWVLDADGAASRLTFDSRRAGSPVWSSDGRQVMYVAFGERGSARIAVRASDGGGDEEVVLADWRGIRLHDWSPDSKHVVYEQPGSPNGRPDLWTLRLEDGVAAPLVASPAVEYQAQVSPDGGWLAYVSSESGREEVYVQRFPALGAKRQVSTGGGNQPRWRGDGTELFYLAPDGRMMAAPVDLGPPLSIGTPKPLFQTPLRFDDYATAGVDALYDVTDDGQRFVVNAPPDMGAPITVIASWAQLLRR